jgi:DNA polymerase-3 subunit gamma/tau
MFHEAEKRTRAVVMSEYIVTARKWRPMKFEDVVGQTHVTATLRNAIASKRLAHAYLFSGPRGVGKTTTARLLAKAVNCLHPVEENPDNTCDNCREITDGRSFDVLEIDGASNRGVEEIRNLREAVRYAPAKGRYKVYIIDEVHMLTKEAFNALLKTLEEPPSHVLFIFATTEIHKVPATILSRCQRFDFRRITVGETMENLKAIAREEGLQFDDGALLLVAKRGDGSLRDAQSLFDQAVSLCGRTITHEQIVLALNIVDEELYFRVTDLIKAKDARGGIQLVEELLTRGHDIKEFLVGLGEHFRDILVAKTTGSTALLEASDIYRARYTEEAKAFTLADLLRYQRFVNGTEAAIRWSSHPRFKLEADLVQLITMPSASDVAELVDSLDLLKKKLADGGVSSRVEEATRASYQSVRARSPEGAPVARSSQPQTLQANPTPHTIPSAIAEGEVSARWQEFIADVRKRRISLGSVLESTQFLGIRGDVVRIGCADDFAASSILRNREPLTEMFQQLFGVHVRLEVETKGGTTPDPEPTEKPASVENDDHPVIAAMKRELGAEPL